jgi:hypothetical protein
MSDLREFCGYMPGIVAQFDAAVIVGLDPAIFIKPEVL